MNIALLVVTMFVLGYGLTYFLWLQVNGVRLSRQERRSAETAPATDLSYYVLVPCLNEEAVIGATVENLVAFGGDCRVVVIDDGSDDATARVATEAGGGNVLVVSRTAPNARQGKGKALNFALAQVVDDVTSRGLDPDRVVIVVMDADGRLSRGAAGHVSRLFDDPKTGGVQLQVRIRNRGSLLTAVQDVGFWGLASTAQMGRNATKSVSLGGNGQFARLSALLEIGDEPWSESLTEDLDLTVSLHVRGWTTRQTGRAIVEQEAPEAFRLLVRQRTRWAQGHMMTAWRTGELFRSRRTRTGAFAELAAYLWTPWASSLAWSLLAPALLFTANQQLKLLASTDGMEIATAFATGFIVLTSLPLLYGAAVYRARTHYGYGKALWLQTASTVLLSAVTWLATWRALYRTLRGAVGWDKTARVGDAAVAEQLHVLEPSLDAVPVVVGQAA